MGDIYFIIIPVVAVVVVLKLCLICCRIWLYQKRRQERLRGIQERGRVVATAGQATARVIAVRRVSGPGGIAQQTSYAIEQPGCPTRQVTRTIIVRPATGRPNDPNLPPSYDQAVTGADRSVKVEEGQDVVNDPQLAPISRPQGANVNYLPPPSAPAQAPVPHMPLPHMPPPRNSAAPPPAYSPPTAPIPSAPTLEDSDEIDASDRQRLLS